MKLKTIVIQPLLIAVCSIAVLHGQTPRPADPYVKRAADKDLSALKPDFKGPKQISFCFEEFSLPLAMAAKLRREGLTDAEIYQRLIAEVDKGTAIQESFTLIRTRSGEIVTSEAISEVIYPTEFEPAQVPKTLSVATSQPTGKKSAASCHRCQFARRRTTHFVKRWNDHPSHPHGLSNEEHRHDHRVRTDVKRRRQIHQYTLPLGIHGAGGYTLMGAGGQHLPATRVRIASTEHCRYIA
ncbi:hypothetical protein, partial [Rubritalea profundi]